MIWLFEQPGFWLIFAGCVIGLIALVCYAAVLGGTDPNLSEMEGSEVSDERPRAL